MALESFLDRLRLGNSLVIGSATSSVDDALPTKIYLGPTIIAGKPRAAVLSGGEVEFDGEYVYHTFTASANLTVTQKADIEEDGEFEMLLVGGGGTGGAQGTGAFNGGGGGAGRYVTVEGNFNDLTLDSAYTITVGTGAGASDLYGNDTVVFGHTAPGGGSGKIGDGVRIVTGKLRLNR